jgi:hypothetical protein
VVHDGAAAGRLAEDGDAVRVAAELGNVFLNPLESQALVMQAGVGGAVGLEGWPAEPAESSETVVNSNCLSKIRWLAFQSGITSTYDYAVSFVALAGVDEPSKTGAVLCSLDVSWLKAVSYARSRVYKRSQAVNIPPP